MKKILLLLFVISITGNLFSQEKKSENIKSIVKIKKLIRRGGTLQIDTTYFDYQNGKLTSFYKKNSNKVTFKYNDKGLLSEKHKLLGSSLRVSKFYEYDDLGYIVKVETKENNVLTATNEFIYVFEKNNDFIITANYKDIRILNRGNKFLNKTVYEMKNNILTIKKESVTGKFKNKSTSIFTYENQNLKLSEFGVTKPKSRYTMSYSYDEKNGLNKLIMNKLLGDKYFINSFLIETPNIIRPLSYVSNNNLISEKIEKKSKTISVTVYNNVIEYNSNKMPVRILRESLDKKAIEDITIEYD